MSFFDDVEAFRELTSMPENGLDSLTQAESTPLLTMASPAKKLKKTNAAWTNILRFTNTNKNA